MGMVSVRWAWQTQWPGDSQNPRPLQLRGQTATSQRAPTQPEKQSHTPGAPQEPRTQPSGQRGTSQPLPPYPGRQSHLPTSGPLATH
jgi:hypothetical protein